MKLTNSICKPALLAACLALLFASSAGHAEIYKWVDANGRTHFSQNKEDAGKAKVEEVRIKSDPAPANNAPGSSWQDRELEFRQRQAQQQLAQPKRPHAVALPKADAGENGSETDASRCELARGILNGTMVHSNRAKTDANDRMIAERDVRTYCR